MPTEEELDLIMYPGNVLFDIIDTVWKYENKYHPVKRGCVLRGCALMRRTKL